MKNDYIKSVIFGSVGLLFLAAIASAIPDLRRYLKMRAM